MIVDDRYAIIGSANINDRSMLGRRDSELAVLIIDRETEQCDIGNGNPKYPAFKFARNLRIRIWEKIFGITGGIRPANNLKEAIQKPAAPASWQAIQKQAEANAALYEAAFPFVPRNLSKGGKTPGSILPTWDPGKDAPYKTKWGKGFPETPLPFQEEFWNAAIGDGVRYNKTGLAGLDSIKGFITALPIHWLEKECTWFPYPTDVIGKNETDGEPVLAEGENNKNEEDV